MKYCSAAAMLYLSDKPCSPDVRKRVFFFYTDINKCHIIMILINCK